MKVQIKYVLRVKRRRSGKILTRVSAAKRVRGGFSPTEPALKAAIREGITAHLKQFAQMLKTTFLSIPLAEPATADHSCTIR